MSAASPKRSLVRRQRAIRLKNTFASRALVMLMAMVDVWVVRMPAPERFTAAPVRMRLRHRSFVSVLVRIVEMAVLVLDRLGRVFSLVLFG
jgi:hypothetical protein